MKITNEQLKQIIKEELQAILKEGYSPMQPVSMDDEDNKEQKALGLANDGIQGFIKTVIKLTNSYVKDAVEPPKWEQIASVDPNEFPRGKYASDKNAGIIAVVLPDGKAIRLNLGRAQRKHFKSIETDVDSAGFRYNNKLKPLLNINALTGKPI